LRILNTTGPFQLVKNKPVEILTAYIVGRGINELNSLTVGRNISTEILTFQQINFGYPIVLSTENKIAPPGQFILNQNYPNPFNPSTKIKFEIPLSPPLLKGESEAGGFVTLKVYDVLGNEITTLVNEELVAGEYEVDFSTHSGEGRNLPSGIYFYQLIITGPEINSGQEMIQTKKMVLLK
jgi:hypothetical protein